MFTVGVDDHYGQLMNYENSNALPAMHKVQTKLPRYIIRSVDDYGLVICAIGCVRGKANKHIRVVYQ